MMERGSRPFTYGQTPPDSSVSSTSSREPSIRRSASPSIIVRTGGTTISRHKRDLPWGIRAIQKISECTSKNSPNTRLNPKRDLYYRISVLVLTFLSYTAFHLSRKPISIVKNVLNQNCTALHVTPPPGVTNQTINTWCDWSPFDGKDADVLLGTLDSAFLFAYAGGMFFSGFIAERVNLRYFLSLGMLFSGLFTYLFGLAYTRRVHNLSYFILVQALAGLFQTTGWPGVVTVVGNWFGKEKRGLIFGLWNSHTSLGNILGSVIAGGYVEDNWGMSFIIPGAIIGVMGFVVFLFLVPKPQHVGCSTPNHHVNPTESDYDSQTPNFQASSSSSGPRIIRRYSDDERSDTSDIIRSDDDIYDVHEGTPMIQNHEPDVKIKAVGFTDALKIPGVVEYSLRLFFAKLVSYTFLYWLPRYIKNSTTFSASESANLSTLFDVGGIIGGIIAGVISDYSGMSATTCSGMLAVAIPMMLVYESYGAVSLWANIVLLVIVGLLVNGPYALITTAVSTELGTHPCLQGNARALATVTAIIDGTGSIGAAVGPLLAGSVSAVTTGDSWKYVFFMLMIADVIALLLLVRLLSHEFKRFFEKRQATRLKMHQSQSDSSLIGKLLGKDASRQNTYLPI